MTKLIETGVHYARTLAAALISLARVLTRLAEIITTRLDDAAEDLQKLIASKRTP